jgi:diguanylate cyclase (GGDEF)-like protein
MPAPRSSAAADVGSSVPAAPAQGLPRRGEESRRDRHGFEIRLLLALVLTLGVVSAFQYVVTSRDTRARLVEEATSRARDDVVFIQQAFESGADNAERVQRMNSRLLAISGRPGVRHVILVDRYGVVVSANNPSVIGTYHGGPDLRDVVMSGQARAALLDEGDARYFRYLVPVELPTGRFALEVQQDASLIEDELADLRRATLITLAIGILVGVVLFFLLGGRSLARMHRRAMRLSSRDGLTGLENHRSFQEALARAVAVSVRQRTPVSLALIDLDDFKMVNDRLGHRRGDELLKKVAVLLETGRMGDRAFRIGGDEFALVLPDTTGDGAWVVCERLWQRTSHELGSATISVGVATLTEGMGSADLHEQADVALYEAKRRGRNSVVSFEELGGAAVVPAEKVRSVRALLDDEVLGTAFQPIWDLQRNRPLGFEALARPPAAYGLSGPAELFQIGEMIGRSQDLDLLSWRCALERARELPDDVLLFLNVSPFTADHGDTPVDRLCEVVRASSLSPSRVVVEFTEKWSGRRDLVLEQAERLRAFGFKLALDDVGAGSGDLEMMARMPVDFLKIDLHVVKKARTDKTARGVLYAITAFAAHSGSYVIAEGIEDEVTLEFLRGIQSDSAAPIVVRGGQGYLLGRPQEGPPVVGPSPVSLLPPQLHAIEDKAVRP